jgi:glyoxylate carboligase
MVTELNPDHNLCKSWLDIIELSQTIEQLANAEEWEAVVASAQQRHQTVMSHFDRFPVSPENADFYMENLNSFMQNEERLNNLVNKARQETIQAVNQFNKNRQAVHAYHSS